MTVCPVPPCVTRYSPRRDATQLSIPVLTAVEEMVRTPPSPVPLNMCYARAIRPHGESPRVLFIALGLSIVCGAHGGVVFLPPSPCVAPTARSRRKGPLVLKHY